MKVAVCLYGQPRTWKHTKDWITTQYGQVDYFCSVKNYNNQVSMVYENGISMIHQEAKHVEMDEINKLFQAFNPIRQRIEQYGQFEGHGTSHYLFKSMFSSLLLKQQFELASGTHYDVVLLQRYDVVTGPNINWFDDFKANDFANDKIFVSDTPRYFPNEGMRFGINDWILGGSDTAMSLFMAGLVNRFNPGYYGYKSADNQLFTSHVVLKNLCDDLGLTVQEDSNLNSRILREDIAINIKPTIEEIQLNWQKLTPENK